MLQEQVIINKLIAERGKVLTDGKIFGKTIYLGNSRTSDEFYEISEEEYNIIIKEEELNQSSELLQ